LISASCISTPEYCTSTAALTLWAWMYTVWRLQPASVAVRVTVPRGLARRAAALAVQPMIDMVRIGGWLRPCMCSFHNHTHRSISPIYQDRSHSDQRSVNPETAVLACFGTIP
jgi:hypothetical protein